MNIPRRVAQEWSRPSKSSLTALQAASRYQAGVMQNENHLSFSSITSSEFTPGKAPVEKNNHLLCT